MFGTKVILLGGSLMMAVVPVAASAADSVGRIQSANQTVVVRDGKVMSAVNNMPIYSGDRVMTRQGGKAMVVAANGCSAAVAGASIYAVPSAGCGAAKSFTPTRNGLNTAGVNAADDESAGGSSTGYIVGGLALVAIAGGIVAATSNTNTTPASP
ncbi:MAG: hypothetical protein M3R41_02960 [Pseudomonadota bacterium]|nr:hypothetical protein [Pseudomonadota bacterium]